MIERPSQNAAKLVRRYRSHCVSAAWKTAAHGPLSAARVGRGDKIAISRRTHLRSVNTFRYLFGFNPYTRAACPVMAALRVGGSRMIASGGLPTIFAMAWSDDTRSRRRFSDRFRRLLATTTASASLG